MGRPIRGRTQPNDQRGRRDLTKAFVDTSILLGFLDGHPACVAAQKEGEWVTTHAHLLELYSVLMNRPEVPAEAPGHILQGLLPLTVPIPHAAIVPAAEIRRKLRAQGKDCSYIDSLGYGVAQAMGVVLLIADESFQGVHGATQIPIETEKSGAKARAGAATKQAK